MCQDWSSCSGIWNDLLSTMCIPSLTVHLENYVIISKFIFNLENDWKT